MIPLRTEEIAGLTGGRASVEATVTGVAIDSRAVRPGDLFVALPGARVHGAAFVDAALAAGAAAALVPYEHEGPLTVAVADPQEALGRIAAAVRERSPARVVGITGSTGKTSTKDVLAALLRSQLRTVASHANQNNEIGLPLTICAIEPDTEAVVAEIAMRGLGQVDALARIARPHVAVITSIGPVHLELLGTIERVAQAKAEILDSLPEGGVAVVPHGEPLLAPHLAGRHQRIVTFGDDDAADVRIVRLDAGAREAELRLHGRTLTLPVNFSGAHNGLNLAAAAAAYDALGLEPERLAEGSAAVTFSRWRGEELELPGGGVLIADCYNANPASMAAALRHLVAVAGGRRTVAVLGDMAELGAGAPGYHDEVGRAARTAGVDLVVGVGELARAYGGDWYATRAEALRALPHVVRPGDAVLVKGSRAMGLEAVVEELAP